MDLQDWRRGMDCWWGGLRFSLTETWEWDDLRTAWERILVEEKFRGLMERPRCLKVFMTTGFY
jgi:hypothetical protein